MNSDGFRAESWRERTKDFWERSPPRSYTKGMIDVPSGAELDSRTLQPREFAR